MGDNLLKLATLFDHLKTIFECELYSNAKQLANLILAICNINRNLITQQEHFQVLIFYAESLYHEHQYREAESVYRQALHSKKLLSKVKTTNKTEATDIYSEVEIKFKIAKCLVEIKHFRDAIVILQSLAHRQRTPKINMLLGRLLHNNGLERAAVSAYKEVLKECPLAFEAIEGLLNVGVKGIDVNTLVLDASVMPQCSDWLNNWIKAHAHIQARKYTEAIETLKTIESTTNLRSYHQLLVLIGECYYHNGDYDHAYNYLKRAHNLHPYMKNGIQILAILVARKNKIADLEKMIAPTSTFPYEYTSESWFVMAQYLFSTNKFDKAVYFVQKACFLNPKNTEALILKARILLQLKKHSEAIAHLRFAQQFAPYRYEVHKGLVETLLSMEKYREAQMQAAKAVRQLGESPRLLVLYARTYLKDVMTKNKAKPLLLRALDLNENYLPAVFLLVEMYQEENENAEAIKLLKKQIEIQPNFKLHAMLGDFLTFEKDLAGALDHYTHALNLDPNNRRALAGLMAMGQSAGNVESTYVASSETEEGEIQENPLEMIEIPHNVEGEEDNESDVMWSDVEIDINNP